MLRISLATVAMITLLGCGSQETATTATTGGAEKVAATAPSAAGSEQAKAKLPDVAAPAPAAAATNPQVESCLGLVRQAEFSRALPVCMEAARIDPDNADVQAAMETAKRGAQEAATGAMAEATGAADAATGAADAAVGDAASKLDASKLAAPKLPGASD